MTRSARAASERRGRWGEMAAVWTLRAQGYAVLERRYKTPVGEIDLVARRGRIVAVVEVKTRTDGAGELVGARQRHRIERAAGVLLRRRRDLANAAVRFDVIIVLPWRLPRHLRDAWRPDR